mgnify:CR=1 FL=1
MKKILLGLFFAMFAFQVNAAIVPVVSESQSQGFLEDSPFVAEHYFKLASDSGKTELKLDVAFHDQAAGTVTGFGVELLKGGVGFKTVMAQTSGFFSIVLGVADDYSLKFLGTGGKLGSATLSASAVPLPAAVWLFGSALMGLFGVSRRKSSAVAA